MEDIKLLIIIIITLILGIYFWIKSPSIISNIIEKNSKKEKYFTATVVRSYGIFERKEQYKNDTTRHYYNRLLYTYYDDDKGYDCELEIDRHCNFDIVELNEGDKFSISKNENGLISYICDGEHSRQDIIDNSIKGMTFVFRIFASFSILISIILSICYLIGKM